MAKDKKSFILYNDQIEIFEELSDTTAGKLVKHIFRYTNDLNPETTDPMVKLAFISFKQALKRDLKKFEVIKGKRSAAGKRSAEIRAKKLKELQQKPTNPTDVECVEQTSTNPTVSDSDSDSDSDNDNVSVNDNDVYYTIEDLKIRYLKNKKVLKAVVENTDNKFKNEKHLEEQIEKFEKELLQRSEKIKTESDFAFHFRNWNKKQLQSSGVKQKKIKLNVINPNKK